jgi:hypothetical protein
MRIEQIKREIRRLRRTVERQPRVWRFRGRRVVHADEWKFGDWSKFPDEYIAIMISAKTAPADWYRDYLALMEKLEDPLYGRLLCDHCVIQQAQDAKKEIDREKKYWQDQGGQSAREQFYEEAGEIHARDFRKTDAMHQVQWRIFNELADAKDRTCDTINYFHCPYKGERNQLVEVGYDAWRLWLHVEWYDEHWNRSLSHTPPASDMRWYHWNEPPIIDVTSYDDIIRAIDDGRLDKIISDHLRYMKETERKIWNL